MKKWFVVLTIAVAIAVPVVLVYRVHAAEDAWARSFGPIEKMPEKYRATPNAKADDLELWSKRVAPHDPKVQATVFDYLLHQTESAADPAEPNPFVLQYNAAEIDAFAAWVGDDPPVFARVLTSPGGSVPNLLPVMRLQKTMLAAAIARAAARDRAGAERLLDASWTLNDSLRRGPTMIEQLFAVAIFRLQLGALRKADVDAAKWIPRIRSIDSLAAIAQVSQMEAWYTDRAVRENLYASERYLGDMRQMHAALADDVHVNSRWLQLARTPIRWFDLPSILEGDRVMIAASSTVHRSEHIDSDLAGAWERGASAWTYIPDPDLEKPAWASAFRRAVRTDAERELTEKVLLARVGKFDASSAVQNAHWINDGGTIHLSRSIDWGNVAGPAVQLRYAIR